MGDWLVCHTSVQYVFPWNSTGSFPIRKEHELWNDWVMEWLSYGMTEGRARQNKQTYIQRDQQVRWLQCSNSSGVDQESTRSRLLLGSIKRWGDHQPEAPWNLPSFMEGLPLSCHGKKSSPRGLWKGKGHTWISILTTPSLPEGWLCRHTRRNWKTD